VADDDDDDEFFELFFLGVLLLARPFDGWKSCPKF
jgi:hypothetical protein